MPGLTKAQQALLDQMVKRDKNAGSLPYELQQYSKAITRKELEYQGWANHATWALHLHLSNDPGLYEAAREWAASSTTRAHNDLRESQKSDTRSVKWDEKSNQNYVKSRATDYFKEYVMDWVRENIEQMPDALFKNMLTDVFPDDIIDWRAIYEAFME